MSLNNFKNSDVILSTTQYNIGQTFDSKDLNLLTQNFLNPLSITMATISALGWVKYLIVQSFHN